MSVSALHGVAVAFGLTVLTMAYAIGHVSGCHLNPAVSVGLLVGKRFPARDLGPYVIAQVAGATAGAGILYLIASGAPGFSTAGGFASNGFGEHSPGGYSLGVGFVCEVVMTFFFLVVILGATDRRAPAGFAPIAIGLGLTPDPRDLDPRDQHLGQPCAEHGPRPLRGRLGPSATLVVLGGAYSGGRRGRNRLSARRQGVARLRSGPRRSLASIVGSGQQGSGGVTDRLALRRTIPRPGLNDHPRQHPRRRLLRRHSRGERMLTEQTLDKISVMKPSGHDRGFALFQSTKEDR